MHVFGTARGQHERYQIPFVLGVCLPSLCGGAREATLP
jgi:hypothetical protein